MLYDPKWEVPAKTKPAESWRQLLLDAATVLEEDGWTQRRVFDENGYCALGALYRANHCSIFGDDFDRAAVALRAHTDDVISAWNDAPERTKEEVVAALRKAADK